MLTLLNFDLNITYYEVKETLQTFEDQVMCLAQVQLLTSSLELLVGSCRHTNVYSFLATIK